MKKGKIILLGLILVLLVLVGVLVVYLSEKSSKNDFNYYYLTPSDERREFIWKNANLGLSCSLIDFDSDYYIVENYFSQLNIRTYEDFYSFDFKKNGIDFLDDYVAKNSSSDCLGIYYFYINNEADVQVVASALYENDNEYKEILKNANQRLKNYLEAFNRECNDCLIVIPFDEVNTRLLTPPYRYSTGKSLFREGGENN